MKHSSSTLPLLLATIIGCNKTEQQPQYQAAPAPAALPTATPIAPSPKEPTHTIASFITKYSVQQKERSLNIELVAKKLDGAVLEPGKPFSFNERVGPRDEASGFKKAPVIFMGEMDNDFGGGTCQTSSTLYAISIDAGLDIVSRRGHSRPSTYIAKGLDATVAYPDVDLVVSNPYSKPIVLHAIAKDGELVEWFVGNVEKPKAKWHWSGGKLIDFERHYRKTNKYRNDHKRMKQHGQPGQNGTLVVKYQLGDKHWTKTIPSNYKPVDEIWEVGLGWDMEQEPWN